jgi:hypothetical protein
MKQMSPTKLAIAGSTVVCAALLSFSWSEQRGVSLSVESAQARVGRPLTPVSVAGVARRQNRRAAYGYGAAGAAAVGAGAYYGNPNNAGGLVGGDDPGTASPRWGWGRTGYYTGGPGYSGGVWNAQASYAAPMASAGGWYLTPSGMACTPGTWVAGGDGLPFRCPGGGPSMTHYAHGANLVGGSDSGIRRP